MLQKHKHKLQNYSIDANNTGTNSCVYIMKNRDI